MDHLHSSELLKRAKHLVWIEAIFLAIVDIMAISGNISVCYAVYRNQRLRSLANMFIVALAVSDLLISVSCMPLSVATVVQSRWVFGTTVCQLQGFAIFTFAMSSVNTMGIIAISRYFCVVKPTRYIVLFRKQRILMYTAVVWYMALIGSVPPLIFQTGGYTFQPAKAMCMYPFQSNIAYTVSIECVFVAAPFTLITFCYAKVFYTVSRSNRVFTQENNPEQLRANVEEAKVTKTLALVMASFSLCWLPISIMDCIDAARGEPTLPRNMYLTYGFLAYLSSAVNPFIYGATNRRFRQEYKTILKKISLIFT
ncbi:unnamed protein product [Porites evermanni]|uniref:G-protein coupled receptors family 1 profile domain-containing protein n=1 Tax=Porites evermanni TaxID=104178 RepID=A0ABN8T0V2_9CNID|nr:unnamed protein product [Porites evermanni]